MSFVLIERGNISFEDSRQKRFRLWTEIGYLDSANGSERDGDNGQ